MGDDRLRAALGYRRFTEAEPRVLILSSGYLVVRDTLDAARELGWTVHELQTPSSGDLPPDYIARLLTALVDFRPDFVLTINHLGLDQRGELATLLDRYQVATASWFVDHPLPVLGGAPRNATPHCQVFCFERTALPWLAAQGYRDPVLLRTGSNTRNFDPRRVGQTTIQRLQGALTFAGNSWWTKAREEPAPTLRRAAARFTREHRVDRRAVASGVLDRLRPHAPAELGPRAPYLLGQTVMAEASMQTRGRLARALSPLGLRVHGDPHWSRLCPELDLVPMLDYATELPALFVGSEINANVTAEQMPTALNQRVWDVPAVGGFLLTDAQEDALELFVDGEEIALYHDMAEAADKVRFYQTRPSLRAAIAARGQAKVHRLHRCTHRMQRMGDVMRVRFG